MLILGGRVVKRRYLRTIAVSLCGTAYTDGLCHVEMCSVVYKNASVGRDVGREMLADGGGILLCIVFTVYRGGGVTLEEIG